MALSNMAKKSSRWLTNCLSGRSAKHLFKKLSKFFACLNELAAEELR
jgi:hypothetical protein